MKFRFKKCYRDLLALVHPPIMMSLSVIGAIHHNSTLFKLFVMEFKLKLIVGHYLSELIDWLKFQAIESIPGNNSFTSKYVNV